MPSVTSQDMIRALERAGFYFHHQTGSHVVMKHMNGSRATIPNHRTDLKQGTLHNILREAKILRDELLKYL